MMPLLSILTTAVHFSPSSCSSEATQHWQTELQSAITAVKDLTQQLHLACASKAKSAGQSRTELCGLACAALTAISILRKTLHTTATSRSSCKASGTAGMSHLKGIGNLLTCSGTHCTLPHASLRSVIAACSADDAVCAKLQHEMSLQDISGLQHCLPCTVQSSTGCCIKQAICSSLQQPLLGHQRMAAIVSRP